MLLCQPSLILSSPFFFLLKARQPAEICAMAPLAIRLSCATPLDGIRYVGMFMSLGVFFAGISVGSSTFGDEKGTPLLSLSLSSFYFHQLFFFIQTTMIMGKKG